MKTIQVPVVKTSTGYEYPISMSNVGVVRYSPSYEYVIVRVADDFVLPEGVTLFVGATPMPAAVPESITPRQGYIILSRYGLLEAVKTYFAALEGQEGEEAKIELEFAQEWKRSWSTLINAAHAFGLTDAQIDQMFIEASVI